MTRIRFDGCDLSRAARGTPVPRVYGSVHPIGMVSGARGRPKASSVRGRSIRAGLGLALVAIAGFALGAYGVASGSAQDTLSVLTGTDSTTVETSTEGSTTSETTVPTEPTTTTAPGTETLTTTVITPPPTTTAASSSSSTPWGWIALALGLAALLLGLLLWRRQRAGAASWRKQAADLNRRCLVALDDVLAKGSVVTGQIEALAVEARALEKSPPDDAAKASVADVRARLDELAQALDADRRLRLGSPPPSADQLSYSTSLIRQQVEQLQSSLRQQSAGPKS
jgi:hypothetical protein